MPPTTPGSSPVLVTNRVFLVKAGNPPIRTLQATGFPCAVNPMFGYGTGTGGPEVGVLQTSRAQVTGVGFVLHAYISLTSSSNIYLVPIDSYLVLGQNGSLPRLDGIATVHLDTHPVGPFESEAHTADGPANAFVKA